MRLAVSSSIYVDQNHHEITLAKPASPPVKVCFGRFSIFSFSGKTANYYYAFWQGQSVKASAFKLHIGVPGAMRTKHFMLFRFTAEITSVLIKDYQDINVINT